jgi:hypothetical protein
VEHWNGTTWLIVTSPDPSGSTFATLYGVACPNTTSCYAVGSYRASSTTKTLVEHWNGTIWSIVTSPNPSSSFSIIEGVSCPSTTSCNAVGSYSTSSGYKTLVEQLNGTSWSIVASPNPTGATDSFLYGVACPSITNCFAVGNYSAHASDYTLIERYA